MKDLYRYLVKAVLNGEFPRSHARIETRMAEGSSIGATAAAAAKAEPKWFETR